MQTTRPDFLDSKYFYINHSGWQLRKDAPDKLKRQFEKYMEQISHPSQPEHHISELLSSIKKHIKAYDILKDEYKKLLAEVEYLRSLNPGQTQTKDLLENIESVQELHEEIKPLHSFKNEQRQKNKPEGKEFGQGRKPSRVTNEIIDFILKRRTEHRTLIEIRKEIKTIWDVELSQSTILRVANNYIDFG